MSDTTGPSTAWQICVLQDELQNLSCGFPLLASGLQMCVCSDVPDVACVNVSCPRAKFS